MWDKFDNLEQAKRSILTEYANSGVPFQPVGSLPLMVKVEDYSCILDFGCGVGRNMDYLLRHAAPGAEIVGYDFQNMTKLAKEYLGSERWEHAIWMNPPLENMDGFKFDLIIATIVLQHIPPDLLTETMAFLSKHLTKSGKLFVHSRGYIDKGGAVWPFILKHFTPLTTLDPTRGDETHQSVVFGLNHGEGL